MSAPRPYETDPFHPPSSVPTLSYDQFLYIYKTVPVISSVWYLHCVLEHCTLVVYACAFPEPLISSHFVPYVVRFGTRYSEIQQDTAIETRDRRIAIWRQRANFVSLRKETVLNTY